MTRKKPKKKSARKAAKKAGKKPAKKPAKKPRKKGSPRTPKAPAGRQDLRRGISPGEIPYESIVRILEAGRSAPSAANLQPWVFLVIREERMREEVAALGSAPGQEPYRELFWRDEMHEPGECMRTCGALVVVCGEKRMPFWRESCWAAIARMEHAALDESLVAITYQPGAGRELIELCGVPDVYAPVAVIAVGLPDGTLPVRTRKPLDTIAIDYHIVGPNRPISSEGEEGGEA